VETRGIHENTSREITEVIAKKIGGNVEQTEKELLSKLLGMQDMKSSGSLRWEEITGNRGIERQLLTILVI
jgi:hypothetical protein